MRMKSTSAPRTFSLMPVTVLAVVVITLAVTSASWSQSQRAPTLRIVSEDGNRLPSEARKPLPTIVITGEDIRSLRAGETRLIQKFEGGDTGGAQTQAGGGVWKTTNGGKTWSLTKTGSGTLILPNTSNNGLTKHGSGKLKNTDDGSTGKEGKSTLILTSGNDVVYEFRDLGAAEFDRVFLTIQNERLTLNGSGFMGQHRPPNAMSGWPFNRLMIVPVEGVGGLTRGDKVADTPPDNKFSCASGFCQCSGARDCEALIKSHSCASMMNCDSAGSNLQCYCKAK